MNDYLNNRDKVTNQLHADLKSGDRIHAIIQEYIFPDLEKIGFKLAKSPLTIKRKVGDFVQEIYFQKNKYNSGSDVVSFLPHFNVTSKVYVKWCKDKYGVEPINEYIKGASANYIPNWDKKYFDGGWYDFATHDNLEIVKAFKDNINNKGLPYLNVLSDKQSAIDYIMRQNLFYYTAPMLFDFAFMLNDKALAEKILKWFMDYKNSSDNNWQDFTLRDIANRQEALNNWA